MDKRPIKAAKFILIAVLFFAIGIAGWKLQKDSKTEAPPPQFEVFQETIPNKASPPGPAPDGMVWIPGGRFSMDRLDDPRLDVAEAVSQRRELGRVGERVEDRIEVVHCVPHLVEAVLFRLPESSCLVEAHRD